MQKAQENLRYYYPDKLVRLITGEMTSAIVKIAFDLDIFKKINKKNLSIYEFGELFNISVFSSRVLIQYLCVIGLLDYRNKKIKNSSMVQKYLLGSPSNLKWIKHLFCINKWSNDLKEKILNPRDSEWYLIREGKQKINEKFYKGWFHQRRVHWGQEMARRYNFKNHKVILDIGGASGGWCIGILKKNPHLKGIVFDMPSVCHIARQYVALSGLAGRIKVISGLFFQSSLPKGADVILLSNVLHDLTPHENRKILSSTYDVLPRGGVLLVSEFFFHDDFSGPIWAVIQAISVLGSANKSGWQPNYEEMKSFLQETGFRCIQKQDNLLIARK
jgi:3-hydroxy-5-methyl-1-naphthoate 3-O-methyltransferase